jgi:hypothetical protein
VSDRNSLLLNVGKCKTITFARSRHLVEFSYMLGGTVLDRVNSINDLGFIMDEKMTFSEHVDVMGAKAFAMLGLIRRLSLEFRDPYIYSEVSLHGSGSSKAGIRKRWNACRGGFFDMLCVVWGGRTCMICHHMRTDAPFCILTPLQKDDRLLV